MCSKVLHEVEANRDPLLDYGPGPLEVLTLMWVKNFGLSHDDVSADLSIIDQFQMYHLTELKIDQCFTRRALSDGFARASVGLLSDLPGR